jgi:hypothetical protein
LGQGVELVARIRDEIADRGVREVPLGFRRTCRTHLVAALPRMLDCARPEGRLADARVAFHEERRRVRAALEERVDPCELFVATHHNGGAVHAESSMAQASGASKRRVGSKEREHDAVAAAGSGRVPRSQQPLALELRHSSAVRMRSRSA